ncbi:hypothetical protein KIPB_011950, partial [Kipferlia bialata]
IRFINLSQAEVDHAKALGTVPFSEASPLSLQSLLDKTRQPALPNRPRWSYDWTPEELATSEREGFETWLSESIHVEERQHPTKGHMQMEVPKALSYFETNLNIYRQLWRVVERSDIVAVITDARIPLAHCPCNIVDFVATFCDYSGRGQTLDEDAPHPRFHEAVVGKPVVIILNKADLVPASVVEDWRQFLLTAYSESVVGVLAVSSQQLRTDPASRAAFDADLIRTVRTSLGVEAPGKVAIGLVGQPSVGKSSLLNGIVGHKVVSVKRTPGHTKHFQTHFLDCEGALQSARQSGIEVDPSLSKEDSRSVMLVDCPGLVIPTMGCTVEVEADPIRQTLLSKALQVATGVFPQARTREYYSSVRLLMEAVPGFWEAFITSKPFAPLGKAYRLAQGIEETVEEGDAEGEEGEEGVEEEEGIQRLFHHGVAGIPHTPHAFLASVATYKNFLNKGGAPDVHRAGHAVLKACVDGKVAFHVPPPPPETQVETQAQAQPEVSDS